MVIVVGLVVWVAIELVGRFVGGLVDVQWMDWWVRAKICIYFNSE